jgi:NitT/TauT family transport system ATP-binding protein
MIDWGRYAEIFAYDFNTGILSLENPGIFDHSSGA